MMLIVRKNSSALDYETEADLRRALAVSDDLIKNAEKLDIESEVKRLQALRSFAILDAERDEAFDRLTEEVRQALNASWACVSLVDLSRQWFKSTAQAEHEVLGFSETPRKDSFCAYTVLEQRSLLVVPDALKDERFRESPLVTGPPHLRFYAGAPLIDADGFKIGALCVLDTKPGALTATQEQVLKMKADDVVRLMTERRNLLQTMRKQASSSSNASNPAASTTESSKAVEPFKASSPSVDNASSSLLLGSNLEPVKFATSKIVEHFASADISSSLSGKRPRANSPERSSDIIREQQQPVLLPDPKTGNVDPDEFLVQLVAALYPAVQLKVKPALELEAYFPVITEEQMARYSMQVVNMARANDVAALKQFHAEHGRDALDCFNRFGEGLLNMACRRGFTEMVDFLLSPPVNLDVRVRDDYGRTPLHDACWNPEPQLEICTWIMRKDPSLFLVADKRGFTPFQYARKSDWHIWRQFLLDNVELLRVLSLPEIADKFS